MHVRAQKRSQSRQNLHGSMACKRRGAAPWSEGEDAMLGRCGEDGLGSQRVANDLLGARLDDASAARMGNGLGPPAQHDRDHGADPPAQHDRDYGTADWTRAHAALLELARERSELYGREGKVLLWALRAKSLRTPSRLFEKP